MIELSLSAVSRAFKQAEGGWLLALELPHAVRLTTPNASTEISNFVFIRCDAS